MMDGRALARRLREMAYPSFTDIAEVFIDGDPYDTMRLAKAMSDAIDEMLDNAVERTLSGYAPLPFDGRGEPVNVGDDLWDAHGHNWHVSEIVYGEYHAPIVRGSKYAGNGRWYDSGTLDLTNLSHERRQVEEILKELVDECAENGTPPDETICAVADRIRTLLGNAMD